jgi:iron complex outermembrane receptor protein
MKKRIPQFVLGVSFLFSSGIASAQTDSLSQNIEDISLEDLMNVKIVSASRKEESSFDAPLSTCAITRKDIDMMGATSIPEALKICPGLIVREMSNGTYDVSIRGFEYLPTHEIVTNNRNILVMIDNRPVFNHLQGGTYWENLPIDLIDVERIEVVNGPSSPLYGPNAVTGVINIITRKPSKDGLYAVAHGQYGVTKTGIGQAAIGYQPNNKFSILGSVNYQNRDRHDISMYNVATKTFESNPDSVIKRNTDFQNHLYHATEKFGANIFANINPTEKVNLAISGGVNNADAMKSLSTNSNVSLYGNRSYYGNLKAEAYNIGLQVSYLTGTQRLVTATPQFRYDYNTTDLYLDYNLKIGENFSLRPAVSYQSATINDLPYTLEKGIDNGVFTNKATMTDIAGSLKADYKFKDKLRIILAGRGDKFKSPDDIYFSYQGIINYKPNENHNIRVIAAKSNSGSFLVNSDVNLGFNVGVAPLPFPPYSSIPIFSTSIGSKDYKLLTNYMYEVGYRVKIVKGFQLDLALFNQTMKNFSVAVANESGLDLANMRYFYNAQFANLPQTAVQNGATLALNILALGGKLNIRPSITLQETTLYKYSPYNNTAAVDSVYNLDNTTTVYHKGSPKAFGGIFIGYSPVKRLNIGLTAYALDKSVMYGFTSEEKTPGYTQHPAIANISGKFTTSVKVSYKVIDKLSVFVNCRNIFNNDKVEYYATDRIGALYMGGISFEY